MAAAKEKNGGRLTDSVVRALPVPARGNKITYDRGLGAVRGFGARVTAGGDRAFVIGYSIDGRERRMTIGSYPAWGVAAARGEAARLRRDIDRAIDPLGERVTRREAPTMADLADRYMSEHAIRKRTAAYDAAMLRRLVLPEFGSAKVTSITFADVDRWHRKVTRESGTYAANRTLALVSKMFALAIRWEMRPDNPCKGVERNHEEARHRYLTGDELRRLVEALAVHPQQGPANAIRLLLLTGARRGEVLGATWEEFDLEAGTWVKPSAHTKQKKSHRVPLSAPARQLLAAMKAAALREAEPSPYLFPGHSRRGTLNNLIKAWAALCEAADLKGVRVHDLRHTYASVLVGTGLSLPIIGALLGHTQPRTTSRYAHLADDPLRVATERAAAVITGRSPHASEARGGEAEVIGIGKNKISRR
jgi:integrase